MAEWLGDANGEAKMNEEEAKKDSSRTTPQGGDRTGDRRLVEGMS